MSGGPVIPPDLQASLNQQALQPDAVVREQPAQEEGYSVNWGKVNVAWIGLAKDKTLAAFLLHRPILTIAMLAVGIFLGLSNLLSFSLTSIVTGAYFLVMTATLATNVWDNAAEFTAAAYAAKGSALAFFTKA